MLLIVVDRVDTVGTVDVVVLVQVPLPVLVLVMAEPAVLAAAIVVDHEVLAERVRKVCCHKFIMIISYIYKSRIALSISDGKDHSEEREDGEEENEESEVAREGTGRGRFRGRFRGAYRPRYFNRPRRNTDGEEGTGDKVQREGEVEQVCCDREITLFHDYLN